MSQSYKQLKEDFVSGLTGGSISEINYVTAVAPIAYLLSSVLQARHGFFAQNSAPGLFMDFSLNVGAILLVITIYSSVPSFFIVLLLSTAAIVYILPSTSRPSKKSMPKPRRNETAADVALHTLPVRPFVSAYRGGMMIITCLAILAVDFKVFPRRFAKVETWGTSLMDIGVGSFVFSAGLVSARPIIQARLASNPSSVSRRLRASCRTMFPLLLLGFIRLYSVKGLDYAEHVTEYGVHWNFFFTLAFLPPFVALCQPLPTMIRCYMMPYAINFIYQILLDSTHLKAYILSAPRVDLLSQNREGVFSFWGYLSIFLAGQAVGLDVLPRVPETADASASPYENRKHVIKRLVLWSISWYMLFRLSTGTRFGQRIQPSRRLANTSYVEWTAWFNSAQILLYCTVETFLFSGVYSAMDKATETRQANRASSKILNAFNKNGLAIFLLANLLTGLVNVTLDTLYMGRVSSMALLGGYAGVLTMVAVGLEHYDISIKI
ncbi:MAG: hypothetical protein Q9217_001729 [Psora testacea]